MWRVTPKAIDLNLTECAPTLIDEDSCKIVSASKDEVSKDVDTGWCLRQITDLEIQACTSARTPPVSCLSVRKLRQTFGCPRRAIAEHVFRKRQFLCSECPGCHYSLVTSNA